MAAEIEVYEYAGCDTCKKAKAWLKSEGITVKLIPIVDQPPNAKTLAALIKRSGLPAKKWINTSGQSYRALVASIGAAGVAALSEAELIAKLAADGKMIKRPVLVSEDRVLVGFKPDEYASLRR